MKKTAVLLIGFGGPRSLGEVRPFLETIVGGSNIPPERVEEVYRHYELIGGVSPFNTITEGQKAALEKVLLAKGASMPVAAAYRHSFPTFQDAFEGFKKFGTEEVIGFVLASFRSFVSREWYYEKVEEGRRLAGAENIQIRYTDAFDHDPLYLSAQSRRVEDIWSHWSASEKDSSLVIFTAHSIPLPMCEQSTGENEARCYGFQFEEACKVITGELGIRHWTYCYQSQSGSPRQQWLSPDIKEVLRGLDTKKVKRVLLVPVGFLCDNVEVIYDLDHEAKAVAMERGIQYFRAGTVGDHPLFIEMMAERCRRSY